MKVVVVVGGAAGSFATLLLAPAWQNVVLLERDALALVLADLAVDARMNRLIEEHLAAEMAGDPKSCVAAYTDDVIQDLVGAPKAVVRGPGEVIERYEWLTNNVHIERMDPNHQWYGHDFCMHQLSTLSGTAAASEKYRPDLQVDKDEHAQGLVAR